ncbi:zinc finger CCCH domain-containing protein 29-like [Salvia divinorum]|uniref:Zinc finger CCCH domain-containing protein 29-like n=1 Tax=Salvia divinorum TaxID=28513 RepID=A0ABD1FUL6_SALDI
MCGGSKSNHYPFDMATDSGFGSEIQQKSCSKLLELAAMDDLPGLIHEIEETGVDVNESRFWYGRSFGSKKMGFEERTPIMIASLYGSTEILTYLIETCKVDVNKACGSDGATALHCAAAGGAWSSVEVVDLLIAASADINAVDANGRRAGELIAPSVKSSIGSRRRRLETLLNGSAAEEERICEEAPEKKEYPIDVSLPDINNGVYGSDEFRMYSFKVKPCSRAYSHDWTECPFVHPGENARRRDPRKHAYTCVPCPDFKKGACGKGDACEYAHGVFESWLHPAQYRTRLCKDETGCARKVCFFAHRADELRPLYASTGSAMPSPKSFSAASLDVAAISPLSLGSAALTPPSSPMWQSKGSLTSPLAALQLPSSRLRTSSVAGDLNPMNLDDLFQIHLQGMSPSLSSSPKINGFSHLRASYPSNNAGATAYGFESAAAAVMNSRSSAFSKRSQSFGFRHSNSSGLAPPPPSKLSNWGSGDGNVDWGFNGEDANKLRKSASFGIRSAGAANPSLEEPEWVNALVRDVPQRRSGLEPMAHWIDQMYVEQEQMVA